MNFKNFLRKSKDNCNNFQQKKEKKAIKQDVFKMMGKYDPSRREKKSSKAELMRAVQGERRLHI